MKKPKSPWCLSKHLHGSGLEADYCNWLLARKQAKEIKDYSLYPLVHLHVKGKTWRSWIIDFKVIENDGSISYHECKGFSRSDDRFRMKLGHFRLEYPKIKIYVNKLLITGKGWRRKKKASGKWTEAKIKQIQKKLRKGRERWRKESLKRSGAKF